MSSSSERNRYGQLNTTCQTDDCLEKPERFGLVANAKSYNPQTRSTVAVPSDQTSNVKSRHQRLVFTDPVAFRSAPYIPAERFIIDHS